jgi:hypothetical protein
MAKVGDNVRFLNAVGGGVITKLDGRVAYVTDADGFDTPVLLSECVVIPAVDNSPGASSSRTAADDAPKAAPKAAEKPAPAPVETDSTTITAALLFEPHDVRRLSQTNFDALLVNDSNYWLHYAIATRDRDDHGYTLFASGTIEPNVQILLDEVERINLNRFENISVQLVAFKEDNREFELKEPVAVNIRMDLTRFVKLHCFTPTAYSTAPVLTVPIVTADKPYQPLRLAASDFKPKAVDVVKPKQKVSAPAANKAETPVIDLHIDSLLDSTAGMSNADMLRHQLDVFNRHMKDMARHHGSNIIFIHGKGNGVLRQAILEQLHRFYPKCIAQDASFREYGFGATQITIY